MVSWEKRTNVSQSEYNYNTWRNGPLEQSRHFNGISTLLLNIRKNKIWDSIYFTLKASKYLTCLAAGATTEIPQKSVEISRSGLFWKLTSFSLPFATSQINQVQFGNADVILSFGIRLGPFHVDRKYGMTAWWVSIHKRGSSGAVLPSMLHHLLTCSDVLTNVHG